MAERNLDARLLVMLAETPVHAGTGAELGAVDLPVQRERHTRIPTIHGSGVKGVLRELSEHANGKEGITKILFGSPPPEGPGGEALEAGSVVVSDARLLLLPVRSAGVPFAWVTSPYLLSRLRRDAGMVANSVAAPLMEAVKKACAGFPPEKGRVTRQFPLEAALVEELEVPVEKGGVDDLAQELAKMLPSGDGLSYWRTLLPRNLLVLSDELFSDLALHCTEVVTRVRLTDEKTVQKGALWTEEYVPADALFYSVLGLEQRRFEQKRKSSGEAGNGWAWIEDLVRESPVAQFGGKETIGRGFLRLSLWPAQEVRSDG